MSWFGRSLFPVFLGIAALLFISEPGSAGVNHAEFIKGPFNSGEQVTKACLQCHEKQAADVMQTPHYKWKGLPKHVQGLENSKEEYGKANLLNNFCTDVEGGSRQFCVKCHAGYGWSENSSLSKEPSKVDCLVCHAKEGRYKKGIGGEADQELLKRGKMDLVKAAQSVSLPDRGNCGVCHFYGGGGDAVKHGDLDSTLAKPKKSHDVHMGGVADMTCQACHVTSDHRIAGASTFLATDDGRVACEDCHRSPHQDSGEYKLLQRHTKTIACQTCHIPYFAKGQATKMSWDWSTVGKDLEPEERHGKETYAKHKGSFVWETNVVPVYAWYNGKTERYLKGQKIKDASATLFISRPVGSMKDEAAKIYPFKVHHGNQPMDSQYRYLAIFQNYGGLWSHYDWDRALKDGAAASGLPFSGTYEFVKTAFYGGINHEVVPKEQALKCGDCHFGKDKRLDWKALGYAGDPMRVGGRFENKADKLAKKTAQKQAGRK